MKALQPVVTLSVVRGHTTSLHMVEHWSGRRLLNQTELPAVVSLAEKADRE